MKKWAFVVFILAFIAMVFFTMKSRNPPFSFQKVDVLLALVLGLGLAAFRLGDKKV
jgi:hypothetical protein